MNKGLTILIGLLLVVVPLIVALSTSWGAAAVEFLKGGVIIGLIALGLVFLLLGITELRN